MNDDAQDYLRHLYGSRDLARWPRFRLFIRTHIPRRRKRFKWQPGMQITMMDGTVQTIGTVHETTVTVKREAN